LLAVLERTAIIDGQQLPGAAAVKRFQNGPGQKVFE
jgi:hypothetical protein